MMHVKDESGNIIPGLFKDSVGAIIVEKNYDYNKYVQEKKRLDKINNLESEVKELKELIYKLLEKQQDN